MTKIIHQLEVVLILVIGTLRLGWCDPPKCNKPLPSNCGCDTDQGTIDLSPLDGGSQAKFQDIEGGDGNSYSYNPCSPFSEGNDCNNVAACQSDMFGDYYAIGDQDSVKWGIDSTGDNLELTYSSTDDIGTLRTSNVALMCDKSASGATFTATGETYPGSAIFEFTLTTNYACPGQGGGSRGSISPGSIMCIVFVVLLTVYLIGGVTFNRVGKGAQGSEMVPNVEFWKEFPGLVKDGFLFLFCRCGRAGSYDKI